MNGQCGIFLIKKKETFKIDMKPRLQISVTKDPVSSDCVIQLVRWVSYCFFTSIFSCLKNLIYVLDSEHFCHI